MNTRRTIISLLLSMPLGIVGLLGITATVTTVTVSTEAAAQSQCGLSAQSNIVFMLDASGSQFGTPIAQQRAAVRNFINVFSQSTSPSGFLVRPLLSAGAYRTTYDPNCLYWDPNSINDNICVTGDQAVTYSPLSNSYGDISNDVRDANPIIDAISSAGTNIAAGLARAADRLNTQGNPSFGKFIVLFSDGHPTFPGYFSEPWTCSNSGCPSAENAAASIASSLRNSNIQIITVQIDPIGNNDPLYIARGVSLLRDVIAYNPGYAFALSTPSYVNSVLQLVSSPVACTPTPTPTPSPIPTLTPTATPTRTPTATQTSTPSPTRTPSATPTSIAPTATPTRTPTLTSTPLPTVSVNAVCTSQSIVPNALLLREITTSQGSQLNRLSREVTVRIQNCPNPQTARAFTAKARRALRAERNSNLSSATALPASVLSCPANATNCTSSSLGFDVNTYTSRSDRLRKYAVEGAKLLRQCKGFRGRCNGSVSQCLQRTRYRADLYNLELSRARNLHKSNINGADALPKQNFSCR